MTRQGSTWLTLLAWSAVAAGAQISPNGPPFQVNTYTDGNQFSGAVAAHSAGDFVVVWVNSYPDFINVRGQRFGASGIPLGGEFPVNVQSQASRSVQPDVDVDSAGNFVVVWLEVGGVPEERLQGQRFDAAGAPQGSAFPINVLPTCWGEFMFPSPPKVGYGAGDGFVVVWSGESAGDDCGILARRYDSSGTPLGAPFRVNSYTTAAQGFQSLAFDSSGNFVVAWQSAYGFQGPVSIHAQRYDADAVPLGNEFQVNTYPADCCLTPGRTAAAMGGQGEFIVAWASETSPGPDPDRSIQARLFAPDGNPIGGQFQVNTVTSGRQWFPAATADAAGNLVVTWMNLDGAGGIQARRYFPSDSVWSDEFRVDSPPAGWPWWPAVAADGPGNFAVVWRSGDYILAQRYDALFRDGSETGDTGRWSMTVP